MKTAGMILVFIFFLPVLTNAKDIDLTKIENGSGLIIICDFEEVATSDLTQAYEMGSCYGFLKGLNESLSMMSQFYKFYCLPNEATNLQIRLVVMKYLKSNPEDLHQSSSLLFVNAMGKSFPCPKEDEKEKQFYLEPLPEEN